ncbi:hypothetical protein CMO91_05030 [Candidatus Woesearchaeota archaeon]|nr:hypothetical protein [Candidatus Woesearchaeota archaeon]
MNLRLLYGGGEHVNEYSVIAVDEQEARIQDGLFFDEVSSSDLKALLRKDGGRWTVANRGIRLEIAHIPPKRDDAYVISKLQAYFRTIGHEAAIAWQA